MNSLNIVAIGGGPFVKTHELLGYGVELAGIESQPQILHIPTAKTDQASHGKSVQLAREVFEDAWGLPFDVLHPFAGLQSKTELNDKLEAADIFYVAGGDTVRMMRQWDNLGIVDTIKARIIGGTVLTGISAGAIAPFSWGLSDTESYHIEKGQPWMYQPTKALGLIPAAVSPHQNTSGYNGLPRKRAFRHAFLSAENPYPTQYGFGIEDQAALIVHDGVIEVKTRDTNAYVTRYDSYNGSTETLFHDDVMDLSEL